MNEREDNKELIQRIAKTLRSHTEPYKEGAWERFSAAYGKPKKQVLQWPYWSAAAVLLLAIGGFLMNRQPSRLGDAQPEIARHNRVQEHAITPPAAAPTPDERPTGDTVAPGGLSIQQPETPTRPVPVREKEQVLLAINDVDVHGDTVETQYVIQDPAARVAAVLPDTVEDYREPPAAQRLAIAVEKDVKKLIRQEPQDSELVLAANKSQRSPGKWDVGLVVSPSLTSERVNMGGGIAVAYRVSGKLSLGSGVSIGQFGVGQNPNYEPRRPELSYMDPNMPAPGNSGSGGFVADAKEYREVTSVTSSVVTLDIPFDLRYDVAKGFYTSVGVSYVAVLNEQRTSHFVDRLNERTLANSKAGHENLAAAVEAVISSEKIDAQPLKGKGYAGGFLNFSIGRKIPLSSKLSLAVEPYFKLPVGRLSRADMDFTNGGIRIVTGF